MPFEAEKKGFSQPRAHAVNCIAEPLGLCHASNDCESGFESARA